MFARVCVCSRARACVCVCVRARVCVCVCSRVCVHSRVCVRVCAFAYVRSRMCIRVRENNTHRYKQYDIKVHMYLRCVAIKIAVYMKYLQWILLSNIAQNGSSRPNVVRHMNSTR